MAVRLCLIMPSFDLFNPLETSLCLTFLPENASDLDLHQNCLTLMIFIEDVLEKVTCILISFSSNKNQHAIKKHPNYPAFLVFFIPQFQL